MNKNPLLLNRRSIRLSNYDYSNSGYYFVTICVQNRLCLLGEVKDSKMIPNKTGRMVQKIWDELPDHYPVVTVDAFALMPNHLHGIVALNVGAGHRARPTGHPRGGAPTFSLPDIIHRFKSLTTTLYRKQVQIRGSSPSTTLWQRNYYEHVIRREESLDKIRRYILENPLKWELDEDNPQNILK